MILMKNQYVPVDDVGGHMDGWMEEVVMVEEEEDRSSVHGMLRVCV